MTDELKPKRGRVSTEEVERLAAAAPKVSPLREGPPLMEEDPGQMDYLERIATIMGDDLTDESLGNLLSSFPTQPKGLHAKLAEVMLEAGRIPKNGTAPAAMGGYKFVQVGDAADVIRVALASRGITMLPESIETDSLQLNGGSSGKTTTITVKTAWRLTDAETGQTAVIESLGTGADNGDKFSPKAQTNAMKYALLMGFMLSTGDDPEASPDDGGAPTITTSSVPGVRQGGRQTQITEAQIDTIRRAAKDNGLSASDMVTSAGLVLSDKTPAQKEFLDGFDTEVDEGEQRKRLMEFLSGLSFAQAGDLIKALTS